MKPYVARPVIRTRFQAPVSPFLTQPFGFERPVFKTREMMVNSPSTNILRLENGYQIQLAVPGVPKNQIQISVADGQLTVSATNPNQEKQQNQFLRREFDLSSFNRTFTLHKNADTENLKATFDQGILNIVIPDKEPEVRKIEIQ